MNTSDVTETIIRLTGAIDCLSMAQLKPMEVKHRMAIGDEIQRIYAIIADITQSHAGAWKA